MARFDVHRPSVIDPSDYEYVSMECIKIESLGDCHFIMSEREKLRAHMARTGGKYSGHDHGGNCGVCGNVNAIYTSQFYHAKSNSYVRVGSECAEKLGCYEMEGFKSKCANWIEARAGKNKAKAALEAVGAGKAWELYVAKAEGRNEDTVVDMVGKLVKYGSISDRAMSYLKVLVDRIERAPEIAAARAAENAAAAPVPVVAGRMVVEGEVLSVKKENGFYGYCEKALVRHESGWKVFGNLPGAVHGMVERGDKIRFKASVKVSDNDPKFSFWKRPTNAEVIKKAVA